MRNKVFIVFLLSFISFALIECQYQTKYSQKCSSGNRAWCCRNRRHWRCITRTPTVRRPGWRERSSKNRNFNHEKYPYTNFGARGVVDRNYNEHLSPNHQLVKKLNKLPSTWVNPRRNSTQRKFDYGFHQYNRNSPTELRGKYVTRKTPVVYFNRKSKIQRTSSTTRRPLIRKNFRKFYQQQTFYTKVPASKFSNHNRYVTDEQDLSYATQPTTRVSVTRKPFNKYRYSYPQTRLSYQDHRGYQRRNQNVTRTNTNLRFDRKTGIALGKSSTFVNNRQRYYPARNTTYSRYSRYND